MDHTTLTVDNSEFFEAMQDIIAMSSRELPEVIDGVARDVCFAAARRTKQASKAGIERLRGKPMMHATATKEGYPKMQGNEARMHHIVDRRLRTRGYSKAIWIKLAKDLGAKLNSEFNIRHAEGIKAKQGIKPTVYLNVDGIKAEHVRRVMQPALNASLPLVTAKMRKRVASKLAQIARKKQGKR